MTEKRKLRLTFDVEWRDIRCHLHFRHFYWLRSPNVKKPNVLPNIKLLPATLPIDFVPKSSPLILCKANVWTQKNSLLTSHPIFLACEIFTAKNKTVKASRLPILPIDSCQSVPWWTWIIQLLWKQVWILTKVSPICMFKYGELVT